MMNRVVKLLGSIRIAVPLLITIAIVLAWGTVYESRYGTAAVQRFIYTAWWFQALLGFLALNLAIAAAERYPWKRPHLPFLLAHLGIISILLGGILGGRSGSTGSSSSRRGPPRAPSRPPPASSWCRSRTPGWSSRFRPGLTRRRGSTSRI